MNCELCNRAPARRRGVCWACYAKMARADLPPPAKPGPHTDAVKRLQAFVRALRPEVRSILHEATRPTADATSTTSSVRVVRHG